MKKIPAGTYTPGAYYPGEPLEGSLGRLHGKTRAELLEEASKQLPREEDLLVLGALILKRLRFSGAFGNSLRQFLTAEFFLSEAILREVQLSQYYIGTGSYSLRELVENHPMAELLEIAAPAVDYPRSVIVSSAIRAMKVLLDSGALVRKGHRYQLGNLEEVFNDLDMGDLA